ncbi:SBBP repeat-containing protein [Deinococcus hopiensis]|uniref:SBBP repeat-containing protein n=1 Tax=Deinococcus hopiensis TaxID=309885 RepID=UPI0014838A15|nr:SBBP repeat-containing protein [Deinococcus hopiensis]
MEATISSDGQLTKIQPLNDGLTSQAAIDLLSNFTFTATSGPTTLNDAARARRFITTVYSVKNNSNVAVNNLMLVAVNRPTNLGGTAFSAITLNDGTKTTDAKLARSILPAHGTQSNGTTTLVNPSLASLQAIPTNLANTLTSDGRASGRLGSTNTVLDYGFTVRKVNTATPGTLGAGETGTMALSYSTAPSSQVKSVTLTFAVVTDDVLSFTESLEQQSETEVQLDAALVAQTNRTAVELRKLPGSTRANMVNGLPYATASYPSIRTALPVTDFPRGLILTKVPQGLELSSSSSSVTAAGNITLTSKLEQSYAPMFGVNFKKDGVSITTSTTVPYTAAVSLSGTDNGIRNFTAEARDGRGNIALSSTVPVDVNIPIPFGIRQFGTMNFDAASSVATDSNGFIYVAGFTDGNFANTFGSYSRDAFIAKFSPSGNLIWVKQFGLQVFDHSGDDEPTGVALDSGGNVYIVGNIGQGTECFIAKFDSSGNQQWIKYYGTTGTERTSGVAVDQGGNIYTSGYTNGVFPGNGNTSENAFIMKYDPSGNQVWVKQFGAAGSETARDIAIDSSENIYVAGDTEGTFPNNTSSGSSDVFLAKYTSSGSQLWVKQYGTNRSESASGIAIDSTGNIHTVGNTYGAFPGSTNPGLLEDIFISKYDSNGSPVWIKQLGTAYADYGMGIATDSNNNAYITGFTKGDFPGYVSNQIEDVFIARYNQSGTQQWLKQFGSSSLDDGFGISVDLNNNIYAVGYTGGTLPNSQKVGSLGTFDAFIVKYDPGGILK